MLEIEGNYLNDLLDVDYMDYCSFFNIFIYTDQKNYFLMIIYINI